MNFWIFSAAFDDTKSLRKSRDALLLRQVNARKQEAAAAVKRKRNNRLTTKLEYDLSNCDDSIKQTNSSTPKSAMARTPENLMTQDEEFQPLFTAW